MKLSKTSLSPKPTRRKVRLPPVKTDPEFEELGPPPPRRRNFSAETKAGSNLPALTNNKPASREIAVSAPEDSNDAQDLVSEETDEIGQRLLPGVSKRTIRRLNSMFGQRSDIIINLLETTDTDGAASLTTRTLVQTLVDILPVTERAVRKSKGTRGVMGLNQIISQIRELLHDLQAFKDRDQVGQRIVDQFVRPSFMDMAMQITNLMVELDAQAKSKMSREDYERYHSTAESMKSSLADFMRRQYEEISKGVRSSI